MKSQVIACVCGDSMKIPIFKKCFFLFCFLKIGIFFNILQKSPKFHWECGRMSAPENTKKKNLSGLRCVHVSLYRFVNQKTLVTIIDLENARFPKIRGLPDCGPRSKMLEIL